MNIRSGNGWSLHPGNQGRLHLPGLTAALQFFCCEHPETLVSIAGWEDIEALCLYLGYCRSILVLLKAKSGNQTIQTASGESVLLQYGINVPTKARRLRIYCQSFRRTTKVR